jgi:pimeloyl-ACP methyl ester carboxylesterase
MRGKLVAIVLIQLVVSAATRADDVAANGPAADFSHTWLLHLPGIGGEMSIDRTLVRGLKEGGWDGPTKIYDWTENDPGIDALHARKRNDREAQIVADMIEQKLKEDPKLKITLTSHSGGTGIAVWALEKLPANLHVQTLVLLASALSPDYDLSAALRHVSGNAFVYYSENDTLVLGAGTQLFGTIDGKKTMAAGLIGFKTPPDSDKAQYEKIVQRPWIKEWMAFKNAGSHIGCMSLPFVKQVLAPTLIDAMNGIPRTFAATQPSDPVHAEPDRGLK